MSKNVFLILILALIAINSACSPADVPNTNANTNVVVNSPTNLPPGFSTSPVPPSGNTTPGIPAPGNVNISNGAKGATTPGIPAPGDVNKVPRGITPTPGISANSLKRQSNPPLSDVNAPPAMSDSNSNIKVRTVRKP